MNHQETFSPDSSTSTTQESQSGLNSKIDVPFIGVLQQFTPEEVSKIKSLLGEHSKKSKWQGFVGSLGRFTSHAFVLLFAGFVFTGLVATYLSNRYTTQQQELAAIRSFSDELNKMRVQRVGEVWERLDEEELAIDELLQQAADDQKNATSANDRVSEVIKRIHAARVLVSKNRFWLGKQIFDKANDYLNANIRYSIRKLTGTSEEELKKYLLERNTAKSDVEQVREQFLRGRGAV